MKTNFIKTLFVTLFLLSVNIVNAHDFEVDGIYYNITDATNKKVAVTYKGTYHDSYYYEYIGSVVIPESVRYNGKVYSVTSIGNGAFVGCSGLTSIKIPNSVTSIGDMAFQSCSGLTSITIPNSVTSIRDEAFRYCSGLTSIEIPNSVTSIGGNAFYDTAWYNNQPDGVVYAGNVLYKYKGTMPSNTSVVVKDATLGIAGGAFSGCFGLTSIEIPNSVTSIGDEAFNDCRWLTSIVIPNSVTSIGDEAFNGTAWYNNQPDGVVYAGNVLYKYKGTMPSNTSVVVKEGTLSIGEDAFVGCSGLTSIKIPNSVTSIGNDAFYGCSGLTSIEIPNSVTSIGGSAFAGCSGLTSIEIPNGVTSISYRAFADCSGLKSVTIGNGVTSIGERAFYGCSALASIIIGNSVTSIGNYAFYDCSNLETVINLSNLTFNGYVTYYVDRVINDPKATFVGDFVFSTVDDKHTLVAYLGNATEITLPDNYNGENYVIGNDAFKGCSGLTSVEIPNSVTSIGNYAFYKCSGLASIIIGNSVTSIGDYAFEGCSNLKSVINLSNLTFSQGSSNYGYVAYYADKVINGAVVGDFVFSTVDDKHTLVAYLGNETEITLPDNYNGENYVIGNDAFKGCSGLTSIAIPNSVTSIGYEAFRDCSGLTSIAIPNSVTRIGNEAFYGCSNLKAVINLSNLTFSKGSSDYGYVAYYANKVINTHGDDVVGDFVFSTVDDKHTLVAYFGDATDVTLPGNYNGENYVIGNDAFSNCSGLTSITIPNSVTSIGDYAFDDCTGLTSVTIPNSVTSIGSSAFNGCTGLTSVVIPNSVTSIGNGAFYNCSELKEVHINEISAWCNISFGSSNANPLYYAKNLYLNDELITELTIPNSVRNIRNYAFYDCSGLASITIPNSITSIGERAFYGCSGLKTVINLSNLTFSKGSSDYGYVAYYADKVINAHNGVLVGDFVFSTVDDKHTLVAYFGDATDVTLPGNYNGENYAIGDNVFKNNSSITSIEIPNSVTSIGNSAFYGCSGLTSITIPNSVTSIGYSAFKGCNNIKFLEINTASVGTMFRDMKSLRRLVIGNDIENIPDNAFNGCSNLSSITVGSKIKEIKSYSFNGCNNIAKVFWLTNTPPTGYEYLFGKINYVSNNKYTKLENKVVTQFLSSNFEIDGIVYIPTSLADRKCCVADYNPGVNNRDVSIPSTVTYQGVELIVGDIMPHAFYKNELAEAMALENKGMVGESAFEGCNNLARVEIPQSITRIEDHAFRNCTALTDAFFFDRETLLPLGAQLFAECPLDTLYLGAKIEYISEASESTSPFCGNKSLKTVIITDVETDIYDYEFYGCSGLEMAVVGDGVERIGRWTFSGCSSLKNFTFGSNVSTIGEEAFSDCTAVTNITGRAVQPPVCGAQALDDINKWNCTLTVPSQNGNSYKTAEQWKEFIKIENFVTTDNYVTYILEGEVYKTLLLTPGKRIIAPYVADKEDAPFAGWDLNEYMQDVTIDGPTKIETETITEKITLRYPVMPDRDIIVYGWYAGKEYTITYIVDGEVFATDSIAFGSEITLREQPTKEGYTFSGWSEAPTTMPAKDITIEGTFILDNTAIDDIEFENKEITVYDLNGIRVHDTENLTRGIYIINGKKVLVK